MLNLRLANLDDMVNVFNLSNDDIVRQNSIHHEKIKWEEHCKWFKKRILKKDEPFYIAEDEEKNFIGQVRIDKKNEEFIISISIKSDYRGKGLASEILKKCIKTSKIKNIIAYIYDKNTASIKSFENVGFKNSNILKYTYNSDTDTSFCQFGDPSGGGE